MSDRRAIRTANRNLLLAVVAAALLASLVLAL